jgi:hypothetical protein
LLHSFEGIMKNRRTIVSLNLAALLAILGAGCQSGVSTAPVKGTVTLDGNPLANGTCRFEAPGLPSASGKIVNGEIVEVTTSRPNDGVPVGSHKVAIWSLKEAPNTGAPKKDDFSFMTGTSLIPAIYNDPDKSGLTAVIKPGPNTLEFKLFSNPAKAGK